MARPRRLVDSIRDRTDLPAGPLLVALSGGADSSVLAWLASTAVDPVRAVFVNHALPASAQLQAAAEAVAAAIGLELDVVDAPVDPDSPSFEDVARRARYEALLAAAKPEENILTGHTSDDQAETVLGNVLRGAGAAGLAGIPVRRGRVHRPLLSVTRHETRELATELDLPFADDPENQARHFRRNRLRASLIPQLESEYNPALREALARTAAVLAADDRALEQRAAGIPVRADGEVVAMSVAALAVVEPAVAARAVRRALRTIRGPHGGTHEEVTAIRRVAAGERAGAELAGGLRVEREGPLVVVSGNVPAPAASVEVVGPGVITFDRWRLQVSMPDALPRPRPLGSRTLLADADRAGASVVVRPAATTDRVEITGGTKSVDDALAERGVARRLRRRWPVVVAGDRVVLIPGIRMSAWALPGSSTTRYLQVDLEREY